MSEQLEETWLLNLLLTAIATNDVEILTSVPPYIKELYYGIEPEKYELIALANKANNLANKLKEYILI